MLDLHPSPEDEAVEIFPGRDFPLPQEEADTPCTDQTPEPARALAPPPALEGEEPDSVLTDDEKEIEKQRDKPKYAGFQKGNTFGSHDHRKGTRNKFAGRYIDDCYAHWQAEGYIAIRRVFIKNPEAYWRQMSKIIPAQVQIEEQSTLEGMPHGTLAAIVQLAALIGRHGPEGFAKLAAAISDGSQTLTLEGRAIEQARDVSPVQEASAVSWDREDLEREIAARGKSARQDPRGRDGDGGTLDRSLPAVVAGT
jgi:hypothetical protein